VIGAPDAAHGEHGGEHHHPDVAELL
jgi:hypothetical protein